jgi:hypothetical protein
LIYPGFRGVELLESVGVVGGWWLSSFCVSVSGFDLGRCEHAEG